MILDIIARSIKHKLSTNEWLTILNNHGVPKIFNEVKQFFLKPNFGSNPLPNSFNLNARYFEALDFLLWKWKGKLSREWYPYLFGLKQDLQINQKLLTSERIIISQTIPLSEFLNKGELK